MRSAKHRQRSVAAMAVMILLGAAGIPAQEVATQSKPGAEETTAGVAQGVSQSEAEGLPQTLPPTLSRGIPKEVRFNGVLQDGAGAALTGVQGVTFGLYAEQQGGAPLWLETQTVEADAAGRYTALLGAMRADGLPQELFTSNEARWLGVQVSQPGVAEQLRVLLVSVPYAIKAGDAETLGGLPAAAYALAGSADSAAKSGWTTAAATDSLPTAAVTTQDQIAKFTDGAGTVGDSIITESGGSIGIGTTTPASKLHLIGGPSAFRVDSGTDGNIFGDFAFYKGATRTAGIRSHNADSPIANTLEIWSESGDVTFSMPRNFGIGTNFPQAKFDIVGYEIAELRLNGTGAPGDALLTLYSNGTRRGYVSAPSTHMAVWAQANFPMLFGTNNLERMRIDASGNVGIGTTAPAFKLDVQSGQINASGGLCMNGTCQTSWPTGGGSVTSVAAGTGLSASPNPVTTTGTLSFDETYGDGRYAQLSASNSFTTISSIASSRTYTSPTKI